MAQIGFDRRRINGPEESFPPIFEDEDATPTAKGAYERPRPPSDIRPIFLQPHLINQAAGSCYIETEKTKLACAVYGPRQSKNVAYSERGKLNVEVKYTPYACRRRKAPMRDAEDRSLSIAIQQALAPAIRLELFPKSIIDVFVIVIEADGIEGCVASGSVAASTALADAGIEMIGLVLSCSASVLAGEIWLDPTEEDAKAADGTVVLSCIPALGTVTNIWQSGKMSIEELVKCTTECQERCSDVHSVVAQALRDNETGQ
ncbi:ribosomal protein S5 domain 2-like protein [Pluteus cervinus]|uniref:Ribosomal protein S5 domain 2-like protein n=1 Tax=Pluteus cervinus TaxID=181527 RepID=A0ACD3BE77_9AGAR|nr:ribosomal protein S5 domain 2-like protein [Pluteus cervinus]